MTVKLTTLPDGQALTIARYCRDGQYRYSVGNENLTDDDVRRVQVDSLAAARITFDDIEAVQL